TIAPDVLSLHDALPTYSEHADRAEVGHADLAARTGTRGSTRRDAVQGRRAPGAVALRQDTAVPEAEEGCRDRAGRGRTHRQPRRDRKSTRLNSSHVKTS